MQKKLLAVAVLSAFSGVAAAQSANVTLYGTLQNELQMRAADRADGSAQPVAGQESTFRTTSSYVNAAGATNANVQNYSSRMASQSAGSNFGVRGTEDLGNGLSAFFQIELATTIGGPNAFTSASGGTAATYRNTGLGLRSNTWGSYMFGQWDVPFDTIGNNTINGATSGPTTNVIYSFLGGNAAASGSVSAQTFDQMCNAGGVSVTSNAAGTAGFTANQVANASAGNNTVVSPLATCLNHGMNFSARRSGQLQWWSPNWNGFEVRVGYQPAQFTQAGTNGSNSSANPALNNASGAAGAANSLTSLRPTAWDLAASYTNGGLKVVGAYQAKKDFVAQAVRTYYNSGAVFTSTAIGGGAAGSSANAARAAVGFSQDISGSKDRGWRLGVSYKFDMGLTLGALYENLKWDMSYSTVSTNAAASNVNVTQLKNNAWRLQANYATGNHTFTGEYAKKSDTTGSTDAGATNQTSAFNGTASGAKEYILGYAYSFSKRTSMLGYYMAINNDANAAYGPTFGGIAGARGNKAQYYGVGLRHAF